MESPSARDSHFLHKIGHFLYLYGGKSSPEETAYGDMWRLDVQNAQWDGNKQDVSGCVWESLDIQTPGPLASFGSALVGRDIFLHGGFNSRHELNSDLWRFGSENESWEKIDTMGKAPKARHSHTLTLLEGDKGYKKVLVVFGGLTDKKVGDYHPSNEVFLLDLENF